MLSEISQTQKNTLSSLICGILKQTNRKLNRQQIGGYQRWGLVGEMHEGGQRVQTSSYEAGKSL